MENTPVYRERIFHQAAEISDPEERAAFVEKASAGDIRLRAELEALLQHDGAAGSFLEGPALASDPKATSAFEPIVESVGTTIGPYKLREQIGEGGFGLVFVADQQRPVRRKVALKVIKPGMDSREVLARFKAEQQALALMDHPNIAQVFDAGTTDTGRPYFVMELVKGIPIVEYCDQQTLDVRERLDLFVSVCQAVQHAHTKGVIHRDLKPANVMVAPHDGVPVVKVIDFGVAKAIGQQLTEHTIYTQFSQMIGTPLYMSPEQAEINAMDVDIRSDVYSLGVILYELLTGVTPIDRARLKTAALAEVRRIIKEEDPPKPSTRLSSIAKTLTNGSKKRQSEPSKLSALVAGDLDWIVMKSLEKERKRRYQTASALAEDVGRYMSHEPIEARPPTLAYRARKFVRRNRAAVGITIGLFAAMLLTAIGTSVGMVKARDAARRATQLTHEKDDALTALGDLHRVTEEKNLALEDANRNLDQQRTDLLLGQAEFLIQQRESGYKNKVLEIVRALVKRELPEADCAELRDLAVACLGDPIALEPVDELEGFSDTLDGIDMNASGTWLSICLGNGGALLYEVATGQRFSIAPPLEWTEELGNEWTEWAEWTDEYFAKNGMTPSSTRLAHYLRTTIRFVDDGTIVLTAWRKGFQFWTLSRDGKWRLSHEHPTTLPITRAAVTPDGTQMVLSHAYEASLWNISDRSSPVNEQTIRLRETEFGDADDSRPRFLWHVDISPDGEFLAGNVHVLGGLWYASVWNLREESLSYIESAPYGAVGFSRDGRWLSVTSFDGIEVFDAKRLDQFSNDHPVFYQRSNGVLHSDFTDAKTLIIPSRQTDRVRVWDMSTNRELGTLKHPGSPKRAVSSRDGSLLATASRTTIRIWEPGALAERIELSGHERGSTGLSYSPDGKLLASTGKDDVVRIWDPETGELLEELDGGGRGQIVGFSSHGRWLAAGTFQNRIVRIWDTQNWDRHADFVPRVGSRVLSVHFCDADRKLAVSGTMGVRLFTLQDDPTLDMPNVDESILLDEKPVQHLVSNQSVLLWAAEQTDRTESLRGYRFADQESSVDFNVTKINPGWVDLAIHPDGGVLYTDAETGAIEQRGLDGRELGASFGTRAHYMAPHPTKPWLATADADTGEFQIWNRETGERLLSFRPKGTTVWYLAWNPGRDQLAVAYSGGSIELWNINEVHKELANLGLSP